MKKILTSILPDTLMVAGAAGLSYGAWLIYEPAGYLVGGALTLIGGVLCARVVAK